MAKRNGGEAQHYFREHLHDETDECMIWPYSTTDGGYGLVTVPGERQQRVTILTCIEHHGPRPPGMDAAHGPCHNTRCWNYRHLSWRTRTENMADRRRDGTHQEGEAVPASKLTVPAVLDIRARHAAGETPTEIARLHGIVPSNVSYIVRRKTWRHI